MRNKCDPCLGITDGEPERALCCERMRHIPSLDALRASPHTSRKSEGVCLEANVGSEKKPRFSQRARAMGHPAKGEFLNLLP